jgi:hypothetical protein
VREWLVRLGVPLVEEATQDLGERADLVWRIGLHRRDELVHQPRDRLRPDERVAVGRHGEAIGDREQLVRRVGDDPVAGLLAQPVREAGGAAICGQHDSVGRCDSNDNCHRHTSS